MRPPRANHLNAVAQTVVLGALTDASQGVAGAQSKTLSVSLTFVKRSALSSLHLSVTSERHAAWRGTPQESSAVLLRESGRSHRVALMRSVNSTNAFRSAVRQVKHVASPPLRSRSVLTALGHSERYVMAHALMGFAKRSPVLKRALNAAI